MSPARRSPVPQEVQTELERVVERWRQLPLDHALSYSASVRALVQSLADDVAQTTGASLSAVPDCGPATLMDQLAVMVYDASAAQTSPTAPRTTPAAVSSTSTSTLAKDLAALRRDLH